MTSPNTLCSSKTVCEHLPATPEGISQTASKVIFGFWIYIMTDAIMFGTLFATYAVLHNNTFGGPGIQQIASLHHMLAQTFLMIIAAFTFGLALMSFEKGKRCQVMLWLLVSFILGLAFLDIEIHDCTNLVAQGYTWQGSAFLSSYFAVIGVHAIHVIVALLWMLVLFLQVGSKGLTHMMKTRFTCFGLFWNFLTLVWILTFIIVFLMGAL